MTLHILYTQQSVLLPCCQTSLKITEGICQHSLRTCLTIFMGTCTEADVDQYVAVATRKLHIRGS
jgi:hypothetical protein